MIKEAVAYYTDPDFAGKFAVAVNSSIFLAIFIAVFIFLFYKLFWKEAEARRLFWIFMGIFIPLVIVKFTIGIFYKGYVPELLFFFAIPSPKITSYAWLAFAVLVPALFLYFRKKIEQLPVSKFLPVLFIFFLAFSISVAAIRDGLDSVADPYTRTYWEYSGNMPFIHNVKDFLRDYIILENRLAEHSITHPPGYSLALYLPYKIFSSGFLGMAIFTVFCGGLVLWPLFYLWKYFLSESEARRALELFIFIPSFTMMTATSTESFFLLFVWCATTFCYIGWKKSGWLASIGGLFIALSLFCNFLFILLAPFFLFLFWRTHKETAPEIRVRFLFRIFLSLLFFSLFFWIIWKWSGYSIVDNFYTARIANQHSVRSNFESAGIYILYFFMNLVNFIIYLGLPLVIIFFSGLPDSFRRSNWLFKAGLGVLLFFLIVGVFQANVERLWLFILPFFPIFTNKLFRDEKQFLFAPYLWLVFFQIVVTQIMFYTYF